ncbi:MAG: enoyl-CoA hydratase/isomerase family protein [Acidimicrobiales bacterium]
MSAIDHTIPDGLEGRPVMRMERRGPVAIFTFDRPGRLNALGSDSVALLHAALDEVAADPSARVIVVTGAGRAFCAGADISEMQAMTGPPQFTRFVQGLTEGLDRLAAAPQPSIAAINGLALGGGFELALACDLRIASPTARLGVPEILLGVLPGAAGTQRLARQLPVAVAKYLIMTGDPITAEQALGYGLLNAVVEDPLPAAMELAERLASGPPKALAAAKRLVDVGGALPLAAGIILERETVTNLFATADRSEGMTAFLEKRPPRFVGQ